MGLTIKIITGVYLSVMAVIDRRRMQIPVLPGVICIVSVVVAQIVDGVNWILWVPGVFVGLFLYLVSRITRGAVGEGDALVYFLTGAALGFTRNVELLVISLFFSSLVAGFLILFRHVGKTYKIPFVPFTAVAYGVVMLL